MRLASFLLVALPAILSFASSILARGINCKGGAGCVLLTRNTGQDLTDHISAIDPNRHYANGEHIACTHTWTGFILTTMCAFLQWKPEGASGAEILNVAHWILDHGCVKCGSVPLGFPEDNEETHGMLTYNIVAHGYCGERLC
ncbi:hypothetical protein MMC07_001649 [Pseudocyphellaria aurata]|nr:hypothetical protein [Pseudocyphellaria aurata]